MNVAAKAAKDQLAYDYDQNEHLPRLMDVLTTKRHFCHQGPSCCPSKINKNKMNFRRQ
jgi:hypothetical protein